MQYIFRIKVQSKLFEKFGFDNRSIMVFPFISACVYYPTLISIKSVSSFFQ